AAFIAGGTDLVVLINHGRMPARVFIDLSHIPELANLDRVNVEEFNADPLIAGMDAREAYVCGPSTTFAQLSRLPVQALAEAARSVGGPQIRNRGTIAGNIATASPAGDGSTALLALDARVELQSLATSRVIPLREFFIDYRQTALAPDEMIVRVAFPATWQSGWRKLGKRGAMNISTVCCAVGVSDSGRVHVAFGSVGPYPLRAEQTGEFLSEALRQDAAAFADPTVQARAAEIARAEVRPIDDFRASADYRRAMSGTLLIKVLRQLAEERAGALRSER
ncbi:MAG: FAD binding domain-containing protein, partial [Candidatus Sumerlaeaceae bacterium]|nr:FAD binding domain-containing protein [Candidatus Sumerlaeaceae bacterium]